jgi:FkbM family methyltransferase
MRGRRALIDVADRSVGRRALASLSTRYARRGTDLDVEILYDRAWVHRIDSTYVPVSDRFEYRREWDSALATIFDPIEENWLFLYEPRQGDTIVDIGAGDGLDSFVFSRAVGPQGRVLAVEAHPATFVLLEQTCRLNGLSNVVPVQCAVMDEPGSVTMAEEGSHRDFYTVLGGTNGAARTEEVPAKTLDDLCREHEIERIDFLKMNIEGAERLAVQGAEDILERTRFVCVACHDFISEGDPSLATKAFIADFLRDYGFELTFRDDHPHPWVRDHVHGVRPGMAWR